MVLELRDRRPVPPAGARAHEGAVEVPEVDDAREQAFSRRIAILKRTGQDSAQRGLGSPAASRSSPA